jgi:hypothetical protein
MCYDMAITETIFDKIPCHLYGATKEEILGFPKVWLPRASCSITLQRPAPLNEHLNLYV